MKLYVNNVLQSNTANSGSILTATDPLRIGADWSGGSRTYGLLKQVCFWAKVLSSEERANLYAGIVPTDSLALRIEGDDGEGSVAYDTSGAGRNCTLFGPSWSLDQPLPAGRADWVAGPQRTALSFNAINDYCKSPLVLDWNNIDFTAFAWAELLGTGPTDWRGILSNRFGAGAANWWALGTNAGGQICVECGPSTSLTYVNSGLYPAGAGWKSYGARKTGTTMAIFVDGLLKNSGIITGNVGGTSSELRVGRWLSQVWNGKIRGPRVYNRGLSDAEMKRLHESELPLIRENL